MTGMSLVLDRDSYEAPYFAAIDAVAASLHEAGRVVKGAEARVAAALSERRALTEYDRRLDAHLMDADFYELPRVTGAIESAGPPFFILEEPPWRGIFMISLDGSTAFGMLFTKAPHDLGGRFTELDMASRRPKESDG